MSLYDFFRTDDPSHPAISNHLLALKGKKTYYELTHEGITYATNLQPKFDSQGKICGVVGMAMDITERKQAEMKLTESERRFMDVLYASNDAILLIGDNTFIDCNESTARMLGYATRKEFLQTHPSELSPPLQPDGRNSFEKAEEMMRRAIENGYNRFEWMHRRANGEDFPVEVSLTPIVYGGKKLIYCVWRDITERKQAENELKSLSSIVEQSRDAIIRTDNEMRIEYLNPAAEELFGYKTDEVRGKTPEIFNVLSEEGDYSLESDFYDSIRAGNIYFCEEGIPNRRKDGSTFICQFKVSPLFDDNGNIKGYIGIQRDITQQHQRTKQQKIRLDLYKMIADNVEPEQVRQYVDQYKAQLNIEETKK